MSIQDVNLLIRQLAFAHVETLRGVYDDAIPLSALIRGFDFDGQRVPLAMGKGIFKAAVLTDEMPISILTTPPKPGIERPYADGITPEGLYEYKYQGENPNQFDNQWLRRAHETSTPLIYFLGMAKNQYAAFSPVWIVGEDQGNRAFFVSDVAGTESLSRESRDMLVAERRWKATLTRRRLHQAQFRIDVLHAYVGKCAVCSLRHPRLLDAAHILGDTHPEGHPVVPNGLALCKLHHSAFDLNVMGIRPDLRIELSKKMLEEIDGPMLVHGLQGFHDELLKVPSSPEQRPSTHRLEERYKEFRQAG